MLEYPAREHRAALQRPGGGLLECNGEADDVQRLAGFAAQSRLSRFVNKRDDHKSREPASLRHRRDNTSKRHLQRSSPLPSIGDRESGGARATPAASLRGDRLEPDLRDAPDCGKMAWEQCPAAITLAAASLPHRHRHVATGGSQGSSRPCAPRESLQGRPCGSGRCACFSPQQHRTVALSVISRGLIRVAPD